MLSQMIVLCLILDSRQNQQQWGVDQQIIVLCLILDSRQNRRGGIKQAPGLYCALFWIQGKTAGMTDLATAVLYCALFWIQGKTAV